MKRLTLQALLGLALIGFQLSRARADQVTISASKDTTLYEDAPSSSDGAGDYFFSGVNGGSSSRRALVAFDIVNSIPPGAIIQSVTLDLSVSRTHDGTTAIELHSVTSEWGEGLSRASGNEGGGAPAATDDATWTHRLWPSTTWKTPGGDYVATASATTTVQGVGSYAWSSTTLVSDVQGFLDQPSQNFGWILIGDADPNAQAKRFDGRLTGTGPQLVVDYQPPSAPSGACCFSDGSCGVQLAPGSSCGGKYLGSGSVCAPGVCPEIRGACCADDAAATCSVVPKSQCQALGRFQSDVSSCKPNPCPVVLTPFVDPLPLPAAAKPVTGKPGGAATYRLRIVQLKQKLHRDLPPTTVWGFSDTQTGRGGYPGPTIEARSGEPVRVTWVNDLRDGKGNLLTQHALAVDTCLHGANTDAPRTVVHLHGGHVPAEFDGQPDVTQLPGEQTEFRYPNAQRAATIWYHDHALGITRLNVYMGLAGFYLVRDAEEDALQLPSGRYEVPLAIQDRTFNGDGSLRYPAKWQESVFGDTVVVNGKVAPYLEVDRGNYRFRVLNGSTSRVYTLSLSDSSEILQIGNDGGLLPESFVTQQVTLMPGERADIVIDFTYAGSEVVLRNSALTPYPFGGVNAPLTDILKFVVGDGKGDTRPIPVQLSKVEPIDTKKAVTTRDLVLARSRETVCGGGMWMINGKEWGDISERPHLGTTEIWRFINHSSISHPMHMHSLFFQVLDHQPLKAKGSTYVPDGDPLQPTRAEAGWKDTVAVAPFEAVRVAAHFEDFPGRFAYHCHLLEHEDHGMMRQFEAIVVCGDGALARGLEECDDGNTRSGDGCSSTCKLERADDSDAGAEHTGTLDAGSDAGKVAARRHRSGCSVVLPGASPDANRQHTLLVLAALVAGARRRRHR